MSYSKGNNLNLYSNLEIKKQYSTLYLHFQIKQSLTKELHFMFDLVVNKNFNL